MPGQLRLGACQPRLRVCAASHTTAQAKNSFGQSPCLVAAILVAAPTCFDDAYNIMPLDNGSTYASTGEALPCTCNDVVYSLFSACADCQGESWSTFKDFTTGCNKTYTDYQGNVPPSTTIPGWAEINIQVRAILRVCGPVS
jgi:hypothetical protein